MSGPDIRVVDDPAGVLAEQLARAASGGRSIVLTGGSTPRGAYERAAAMDADWSGASIWFGDERCVPPDHEHANYAMAHAALLSCVSPGAVHRIKGELGPHEGAREYERELQSVYGEAVPELDLLLLGLGPDAHCASLFPGDAALGERERTVVGVETPGMAPLVPRITLTLSVLNAAHEVVFLVTGEDKAEAVARAFGGLRPGPEAPASLVRPVHGSLTVLLDEAAAKHLG